MLGLVKLEDQPVGCEQLGGSLVHVQAIATLRLDAQVVVQISWSTIP